MTVRFLISFPCYASELVESDQGVVSDHLVFCEILVQRPIGRPTMHLPSRMTDADLAYMAHMAQQRFDQIMDVLKHMPTPLLLIIRWVMAQLLSLL
jgi:hypothetical protein